MPKYEVGVLYTGQVNYIVEAASREEARIKAHEAYLNNEEPTVLGNEWENGVAEMDPKEVK